MVTKSEIEEAIRGKDDFVKIDYLRRFLQQADNLETRKFILLILAGINEARNMLREAVRNLDGAAEISITYREKIEFYMKETEIFIKMRDFEMADKTFRKALSCANTQEKVQLEGKYKEFYKMQAKIAEQNEKIRHATEIYEKLFSLSRNNLEVKEKLIELYEKAGRTKDAERVRSFEIREEPRFF